MGQKTPLTKRAYSQESSAASWEEIWEAGPYFRRISELMEDAKESIVIVGWQIDSRLPMPRPERPGSPESPHSEHPGFETLREKVTRLCAARPRLQFYFLMWDHAYFFVVERESWQRRIWDSVHDRVHFLFDNRVPFGGSHHEKIALIDGRVALLGGIDLCDERWDTPNHFFHDPRRSLSFKKEIHGPYHDLAVQVTGPICTQIHNHIAMRWNQLSTAPFPAAKDLHLTSGGHRVYLSQTWAPIDAGTRGAPIVRENEFLFRDLIRLAEHRIILEGQYYWSEKINELLIEKMRERKGKPFEVFLILADLEYVPQWVQKMTPFQLGLLKKLERAAEDTGTRLTMGCPYIYPYGETHHAPQAQEFKPKAVYVHSKAVVIDDRFLSIGSTNLAARAFRLDTELNVTLEATTPSEEEHIRNFAHELLAHWNLTPKDGGSAHAHPGAVKFRNYIPTIELKRIRLKWPLSSTLPLQLFFDPPLPWLYPLKRKFRVIAKRQWHWIYWSAFLILLAGSVVSTLLADAWPGRDVSHDPWIAAYAILLTSVWLLPVPFFITSLWATFHLGFEPASKIILASIFVASFIGYVLSRMFPTPAAKYYRETAPQWLPLRIGLRQLPPLISVMADPRVSLRSKIAFQGLYTIPFHWFIFGTWLVAPAVMLGICRVALLPRLDFLAGWAFEMRWGYFGLAVFLSVFPVGMRLWKKRD